MGIFRRHHGPPHGSAEGSLRCSFCNKDQTEVQKLIAGPTVFICDECVQICNDILDDRREPILSPTATGTADSPAAAVEPTTRIVTCTLCGMRLPWEEALPVPERGILCPVCTRDVEAALADKRDSAT